MVIKNYGIKGGFSNFITQMNQDAQYEIKGLLGKGLGLSKYGTHVAFVGGTGVLTFIDLVALLIRVNLEIIDPKIYVCGPPMMNEMFDRKFEQLIKNKQLMRNEVEVM
ncbi:hypothetical protein FGO68_gene16314 [Halteria grandinella]|uniref:Uncharacterized protein n=1 Tax=Halteria grandinella TaxID=5974 RepID=A0A8J8T5U3_HALGN|nr:hypothetical protein FGO68_gene16314 [Halteria grandinella]